MLHLPGSSTRAAWAAARRTFPLHGDNGRSSTCARAPSPTLPPTYLPYTTTPCYPAPHRALTTWTFRVSTGPDARLCRCALRTPPPRAATASFRMFPTCWQILLRTHHLPASFPTTHNQTRWRQAGALSTAHTVLLHARRYTACLAPHLASLSTHTDSSRATPADFSQRAAELLCRVGGASSKT